MHTMAYHILLMSSDERDYRFDNSTQSIRKEWCSIVTYSLGIMDVSATLLAHYNHRAIFLPIALQTVKEAQVVKQYCYILISYVYCALLCIWVVNELVFL